MMSEDILFIEELIEWIEINLEKKADIRRCGKDLRIFKMAFTTEV